MELNGSIALQARGRWFDPSCAHQAKLFTLVLRFRSMGAQMGAGFLPGAPGTGLAICPERARPTAARSPCGVRPGTSAAHEHSANCSAFARCMPAIGTRDARERLT